MALCSPPSPLWGPMGAFSTPQQGGCQCRGLGAGGAGWEPECCGHWCPTARVLPGEKAGGLWTGGLGVCAGGVPVLHPPCRAVCSQVLLHEGCCEQGDPKTLGWRGAVRLCQAPQKPSGCCPPSRDRSQGVPMSPHMPGSSGRWGPFASLHPSDPSPGLQRGASHWNKKGKDAEDLSGAAWKNRHGEERAALSPQHSGLHPSCSLRTQLAPSPR